MIGYSLAAIILATFLGCGGMDPSSGEDGIAEVGAEALIEAEPEIELLTCHDFGDRCQLSDFDYPSMKRVECVCSRCVSGLPALREEAREAGTSLCERLDTIFERRADPRAGLFGHETPSHGECCFNRPSQGRGTFLNCGLAGRHWAWEYEAARVENPKMQPIEHWPECFVPSSPIFP